MDKPEIVVGVHKQFKQWISKKVVVQNTPLPQLSTCPRHWQPSHLPCKSTTTTCDVNIVKDSGATFSTEVAQTSSGSPYVVLQGIE